MLLRFNPLLIGAAALPRERRTKILPQSVCFNPLLIGVAALPWWPIRKRHRRWTSCFNRLLIGVAALPHEQHGSTTRQVGLFQSPSHRGGSAATDYIQYQPTFYGFQSPSHRGGSAASESGPGRRVLFLFQSPSHRGGSAAGIGVFFFTRMYNTFESPSHRGGSAAQPLRAPGTRDLQFQSPSHRGGSAALTARMPGPSLSNSVSIPFSSGWQRCRGMMVNPMQPALQVSIPSSSGWQRCPCGRGTRPRAYRVGFNPLLIGVAALPLR